MDRQDVSICQHGFASLLYVSTIARADRFATDAAGDDLWLRPFLLRTPAGRIRAINRTNKNIAGKVIPCLVFLPRS